MNRKDIKGRFHRTLPKQPSLLNSRTMWGLLFVAAVIWSLHESGLFERDLVNVGGWTLVMRFLIAATRPELDVEFLQLTLEATLQTLAYGVCGTAFSLIFGLVGGILSSEVWWQSISLVKFPTPWLVVRFFLAIPRAIHELIWGLFFINIFGLDPLVAVLAIAIPFGAITAKVFSEILDETPRQPLMALLNSGVSPLNAFVYSLIPQSFPNLLSYAFYRFECSIRSAAVLGIIGAGGLGYQILLSLQSLRYEEMWTFLIALVLLSGSTDFWSAMLRRSIGAPSRLDLNLHLSKPKSTLQNTQTLAIHLLQGDRLVKVSLFAAIGLLIFSFWYVNADFTKLSSPQTFDLLIGVIQDSFPPDITKFYQLFTLSAQTLAMSILAIAIAGIGGILLSFPAANNLLLPEDNSHSLWGITVLVFTRFLLLFTRAIPAPIWALIFLFVLFPGILPGAIALAIHNLGILGRLMAEVIENLDQRPLRSLQALGATNSQIFLYGILPRTLSRFVAYILYRWEVCIRATVIVGLVGAGGLGRLLTEQLSSFDYKGLVSTLICFICLTFLVDLISATVRRSLR
ncbi:MAG: ABC transporter permease subunit [Gloeocapsa sp. UFS-A4-WI-NPMV-4B04]|nr:ABC transporter permease subunit [Gloeocapsa sp. UFS-A4-WI-NPMV-4B04]